jgi:predicted Zn-dependent protease
MGIALGLSGQQTMGEAIDIVFNLVSLGYSRKDELLADKLAVKYTKKAGFNPYAMVAFFEKLKKEAESRGPNSKLIFLSSHPPIEERIKNIENEIRT